MPRIFVVGGPRSGKTTYATKLARELRVHLASTGKRTENETGLVSTDNYIKKGRFEDVPDLIIKDLRDKPDFILEGTQAARVLRRWMRIAPDEIKGAVKVLAFTGRPWVPRTPGQESMAKAVRTVLREIEPRLREAGVEVEHMTPPEMSEEERRQFRAEALADATERDRFDAAPTEAATTPEALPLDQPGEIVQDS